MFADSILGYGSKRFIEVFFRSFKGNSYGYSSNLPAQKVTIFGGGTGRLSILQPSSDVTKVATKKSLVTIFLDIEDVNDVKEYQSDELSTAYWDRETQSLITKDELANIISDDENDVDDSLVAYQSV